MDGERGFILIGDRILYPKLTGYTQAQTPIYDKEEVRVGIYVQVAVQMSEHGDLTLSVYPQVSVITGFLNVGGASYPQISTREEQTTVRLRDGETLVLGGLLRDEEIAALQRIPLLGRIPILGELLTNRKKTKSRNDLVIMITPEVIADPEESGVSGGHSHDSPAPPAAPVAPKPQTPQTPQTPQKP